MLYTISYDIPDDKRRLKIAKILLDYGAACAILCF